MKSEDYPTEPSCSQETFISSDSLRKELTLFDATAVVVGTIIGSGVFLIPSTIASELSSLGSVLAVWVLGGILTIFGALSLAELGSMYPETGGLCTYLRQAYGRLPAFLYAWALLVMIHSGSIAALATAFGLYAGQLFSLNAIEMRGLSALTILALTAVSCIGIRSGKLVQNVIAVSKIAGLAALIVILGARGSRAVHLFGGPDSSAVPSSLTKFGIALVAVLWAYEGWHVISFVAGEMKRPKVDLPRALFYGTAFVMLVYLAANLGYYHTLSATEIRTSNAVAALAVGKVLGSRVANALSLLILVSVLGSMNGMILTGPRVYYAMARANTFPRLAFGQLSERHRTPMVALIIQGLWASLLAASGSYEALFTDVIFTAWIFYGLAVAAVVVLRRTQPQAKRSFCVPGYPWPALLFCTAAAYVIVSTIIERPTGALAGIGFVAAGILVYFVWNKLRSSAVEIGAETKTAP